MDGPDREEFVVAFTDAGQVKITQWRHRVLNDEFGERVKMPATRPYVRTELDKAAIANIFALMCGDFYSNCTFFKCFQATVDKAWFLSFDFTWPNEP